MARFGGVSQPVDVPIAAVLAIYAQETGQGMMFPAETGEPGQRRRLARPAGTPEEGSDAPRRQVTHRERSRVIPDSTGMCVDPGSRS